MVDGIDNAYGKTGAATMQALWIVATTSFSFSHASKVRVHCFSPKPTFTTPEAELDCVYFITVSLLLDSGTTVVLESRVGKGSLIYSEQPPEL